MSRSIPDRWVKYDPMGAQIPGTRFIPIKVPLRESVQSLVPPEKRLTVEKVVQRIPNLGLIIDLTNTSRYYNSEDFTKLGIRHIQINVPGHYVPPMTLINQFKLDVLSFLNRNSDNDKTIAVHCTHGVNRTGFMICHFMITELSIKPEKAIDMFYKARGYSIERENYKYALHSAIKQNPESIKKQENWRERDSYPAAQSHRHKRENKDYRSGKSKS